LSSKISNKDKKDWESFLSKNESLPNKDLKLSAKNNKQVRTYDLHGYSLDSANKKVRKLIFESYEKEINKLIIVTGKGIHSKNEEDPFISKDLGILKNSIPEYISNDNEIMEMIKSIEEAKIEDGGSGALYIYLKKNSIK